MYKIIDPDTVLIYTHLGRGEDESIITEPALYIRGLPGTEAAEDQTVMPLYKHGNTPDKDRDSVAYGLSGNILYAALFNEGLPFNLSEFYPRVQESFLRTCTKRDLAPFLKYIRTGSWLYRQLSQTLLELYHDHKIHPEVYHKHTPETHENRLYAFLFWGEINYMDRLSNLVIRDSERSNLNMYSSDLPTAYAQMPINEKLADKIKDNILTNSKDVWAEQWGTLTHKKVGAEISPVTKARLLNAVITSIWAPDKWKGEDGGATNAAIEGLDLVLNTEIAFANEKFREEGRKVPFIPVLRTEEWSYAQYAFVTNLKHIDIWQRAFVNPHYNSALAYRLPILHTKILRRFGYAFSLV